jgi:hypothetical protein
MGLHLGLVVWLATAAPPPRVDPGRVDEPRPSPPVVPGPQRPASLVLERGARSDARTPRLEPIGGGRLRHRDHRFTAIIEPDGSVTFRDPIGKVTLDVLNPPPPANIPEQAKQLRDRAPDFSERALFPHGPPTAPIVGLGFRFGGLADGRRGKRHSSAKLAFLAATEGLRLRMAHAWHRERLRDEQAALISQLIHVWRDASRSLADRRRELFAAWDACEEGSASDAPLDVLRADTALATRGKIEALVRLVAPAGSPAQYPPAELAALNARRRSVRPFDPYRVAE